MNPIPQKSQRQQQGTAHQIHSWQVDCDLKLIDGKLPGTTSDGHQSTDHYLDTDSIQKKTDPLILAHLKALDGMSTSLIWNAGDRRFQCFVDPEFDDYTGHIIGCQGIAIDTTDRLVIQTDDPQHNANLNTYMGLPSGSTAHISTITDLLPVSSNESQLQHVQKGYTLLHESIELCGSSVVIVDMQQDDTPVIYANQAFEIVTGYSKSETIGRNLRFLQNGDRNQASLEELRRIFRERRKGQVVLRNYKKTGELFWIELTVSPIFDTDGELSHYVGIQHDVTQNIKTQMLIERQRTFMGTLLKITEGLNTTFDVNSVLELIIDGIAQVMTFDLVEISLISDDTVTIVKCNETIHPGITERIQGYTFNITKDANLNGIKNTLTTAIISDMSNQIDYLSEITGKTFKSYLGVPLLYQGDCLGFLVLRSKFAGFFNEDILPRLNSFATQAAIALNNAQRYQKLRDDAMLQERQRLARELHDSVSQTLFSASVIAEILPNVYQTDAAMGAQYLDSLTQLTKSALAEMRSLLNELRPDNLKHTPLISLLHQLCEAFAGRTLIKVTSSFPPEIHCTYEQKLTVYRITQETLNNIVKHAQAKVVDINISDMVTHWQLIVHDDGVGFDQTSTTRQCHGLRIMRERANEIEAELMIQSDCQIGTTITLTWQK